MRVAKLTTLITLASMTIAVPALAAAPRQYVLRHPHRERCRAHYTRRAVTVVRHVSGHRVRRHETICVRRAPKPALPTSPPTLSVHLHSSFTQDPSDPGTVTYSYGASATERSGSVSAPASLPPGVLDFYSDGLLECATAVTASNTGSTCTMAYGDTGTHTVIVSYTSGSASAIETVVEQIEPFSTKTTIKLQGPLDCNSELISKTETESCTYIVEVSTLDEHGNVPPDGGQDVVVTGEPEGYGSGFGSEGSFFRGPVQFTLRREHNEEGWRCSVVKSGITNYFLIRAFYQPTECGTSATVSGEFIGGLWRYSISEPIAARF